MCFLKEEKEEEELERRKEVGDSLQEIPGGMFQRVNSV